MLSRRMSGVSAGCALCLIGAALFAASAQARPPEQARDQLLGAAERLADSARAVELDLAALQSAATDNPELIPVYAGRVEGRLHALVAWERYVLELAASGGAIDEIALVQAVLREAYLQTTEDLRFYAEKVKFFNQQHVVDQELLAHVGGTAKLVRSTANQIIVCLTSSCST